MGSLERIWEKDVSGLGNKNKREYEASLGAVCIEKLRTAAQNALDVDADQDIITRYADLCLANLLPESQRPANFDPEELKSMGERMLKATAQVTTLAEFRVLLECIGATEDQIQKTVAHENAHMNVAEQKDATTEVVGYGAMVMKKNDEIDRVIPIHLCRRKEGADIVAFLEDQIPIVSAPDAYGDETFPDDKHELRQLEWVLSIHKKEEEKRTG